MGSELLTKCNACRSYNKGLGVVGICKLDITKCWKPKEEQKGCETCRRFPRMGPPPGQSGTWYCGPEKGGTSRPPCGAGTECEWWLPKKEQEKDCDNCGRIQCVGVDPVNGYPKDSFYCGRPFKEGDKPIYANWLPRGGNYARWRKQGGKPERKEDTMDVSYRDVAGIRRPTVVAEQDGAVVEEVFHEKDILAGSRDAALVIAGVRNAEKIGNDTSRLEIKVFNERPF